MESIPPYLFLFYTVGIIDVLIALTLAILVLISGWKALLQRISEISRAFRGRKLTTFNHIPFWKSFTGRIIQFTCVVAFGIGFLLFYEDQKSGEISREIGIYSRPVGRNFPDEIERAKKEISSYKSRLLNGSILPPPDYNFKSDTYRRSSYLYSRDEYVSDFIFLGNLSPDNRRKVKAVMLYSVLSDYWQIDIENVNEAIMGIVSREEILMALKDAKIRQNILDEKKFKGLLEKYDGPQIKPSYFYSEIPFGPTWAKLSADKLLLAFKASTDLRLKEREEFIEKISERYSIRGYKRYSTRGFQNRSSSVGYKTYIVEGMVVVSVDHLKALKNSANIEFNQQPSIRFSIPNEGMIEKIDVSEIRKISEQPWNVIQTWKVLPIATAISIMTGAIFGCLAGLISGLLKLIWNALLKRIVELRSAIKGEISD